MDNKEKDELPSLEVLNRLYTLNLHKVDMHHFSSRQELLRYIMIEILLGRVDPIPRGHK